MATKTYRQPSVVLPAVSAVQRRAFALECEIESVLETWDGIGAEWTHLSAHATAQVLTGIVLAWEVPDDDDR